MVRHAYERRGLVYVLYKVLVRVLYAVRRVHDSDLNDCI